MQVIPQINQSQINLIHRIKNNQIVAQAVFLFRLNLNDARWQLQPLLS